MVDWLEQDYLAREDRQRRLAAAALDRIQAHLVKQTRDYVNNIIVLPGQSRRQAVENLRRSLTTNVFNALMKMNSAASDILVEEQSTTIDLIPPPLLERRSVDRDVVPGDMLGPNELVVTIDGSGHAAILDTNDDRPPSLAIKVTCRLIRPSFHDDKIEIKFDVRPDMPAVKDVHVT